MSTFCEQKRDRQACSDPLRRSQGDLNGPLVPGISQFFQSPLQITPSAVPGRWAESGWVQYSIASFVNRISSEILSCFALFAANGLIIWYLHISFTAKPIFNSSLTKTSLSPQLLKHKIRETAYILQLHGKAVNPTWVGGEGKTTMCRQAGRFFIL